MEEFLDEAEHLHTNLEGIKALDQQLARFNESFASWLYVMEMNALTTDWPAVRDPESLLVVHELSNRKAPSEDSFLLAKQRAGRSICIFPSTITRS